MIDVARDADGVRMALEAIFEEDFARSRVEREAHDERMRERMERMIAPRQISPGYFRWGRHLLRLEREGKAGVALDPRTMAAAECEGLLAVESARSEFQYNHPACTRCGAHQENRFALKCRGCGVEFARKG